MTGPDHLPQGWELARLGDLGTWSGGGTPSKGNPAYWENGTVPWVTPKDMKVNVISDSIDRITEEAVEQSAAKHIAAGSVLFVTRSGILAHTFPVALTTASVTVNQDLKSLTPAAPIFPGYVAWAMRAFGRELLQQCSKDGTTVASVDSTSLKNFPFPVAPLPEQHRIVEAIESYFTRLDDAVATLERVQRNLERYRASVLKSAVEGQLVPTEAELARKEGRDYERGSVLLERILGERRRRWEAAELEKLKAKGKKPKDDKWKKKYKEPMRPDTEGLPELPEGWCWASAEQLESGDRKCSYGVLVPGPDVEGGVDFVRVGDIREGRVDLSRLKRIHRGVADRFSKTYLQGGEVLLTLVGTIGRTAVVPDVLKGANVARAVGVIPASIQISNRWLELWLRSPETNREIVQKAHEVARKTLNLEDVRSTAVALPPRAEQDRIAEALAESDSISRMASDSADASAARCAQLRQAILGWAFEGKLVDQDRNDEPASVLLERIAAQREAENTAVRPKSKRRRTRKAATA